MNSSIVRYRFTSLTFQSSRYPQSTSSCWTMHINLRRRPSRDTPVLLSQRGSRGSSTIGTMFCYTSLGSVQMSRSPLVSLGNWPNKCLAGSPTDGLSHSATMTNSPTFTSLHRPSFSRFELYTNVGICARLVSIGRRRLCWDLGKLSLPASRRHSMKFVRSWTLKFPSLECDCF
ncbi:hypothetical protein ES703_79496 [subsurface metagenome]